MHNKHNKHNNSLKRCVRGNFHIANVAKYCELKQHHGNEHFWVWLAADCFDGELKAEHLALTFFASEKSAVTFENAVDGAKGLRWPLPTLSV